MNNVMNYLEDSSLKYGDKVAVIDENGSCTFSQLCQISRSVGYYLSKRNIKNSPIIVFMEKGIDALCAFFGVAYSGNYYSLLNPDFPEPRLKKIESVLQSSVVITDSDNLLLAQNIFISSEIYLIQDMKLEKENNKDVLNNIMETNLDINPLYINFTSGSTGVPKGVLVSHQSVIDFIDTFTEIFKITSIDRVGNQAPFDFDVSVKDIYSCLKTGATLVIIPKRLFSKPTELMDFICKYELTTLIWAVSALSLICVFHGLEYKVPDTITKVMFSGEVMPLRHLQAWQKALPSATFINLYGPTEITCNCAYHIIDPERDYSSGIPVGSPFPNEEVFLLDENDKKITAPDITGEICVRGRTLALGYYNAWDVTDMHFTQNPLNKHYRDIIYKTGDLGILNKNKELCFAGRKDFQIKYLGHRIELEEIERQTNDINEIDQCCCAFDNEKHKLYCFYKGSIGKSDVVKKLKKSLPVYMVPTKIYRISQMPLTKNGKIDRRMLLENAKGGNLIGE